MSDFDFKEYHRQYLAKLKDVRFRVKPEEFAQMQKAAEEQGYPSMRQFILAAIKEKMERGRT